MAAKTEARKPDDPVGDKKPRSRWTWLNTSIAAALVGVIGAVIGAAMKVGTGTFVPVSANYGFILPLRAGTFTAPVSEEVPPDQADRFDLNLRLPKTTEFPYYEFQVSLAIVYDKGSVINAGAMSLDFSAGYMRPTPNRDRTRAR
jgi:hypothetical protein